MKVGLIGFGYWGRNLARIIDTHSNTELAIICDSDNSRKEEAGKLYKYSKYLTDFSEIQIGELDIVVISTPTSTHFKISKFFLELGMHVLCEKPLAISLGEIEELRVLAQRNEKILMVGHIFEYNPVIRKIKSIIDSGELGEILYISMVRAGLGPVREDVNVIHDLATHDISILNFLIDEKPEKVNAVGSCFIQVDKEDVAFISLSYPNNIKVNIQVSWLEAAKERIIKIVGTKKMVIFDDVHPSVKLKIIETGKSYQKMNGDFGTFQISVKDGDIYIPNIEYDEPLKVEFNHFIQCIESQTEPLSGAKSAFKVAEILNQIQNSLSNQ